MHSINKYLLIFSMIFLISLVSAETSWGSYKQGDCIDLTIVSDADSCVLSSLKYPNSTNIMENITMTKIGSEFNFTNCNNIPLGIYEAKGMCDVTPWDNNYEVTTSGNTGTANIVFFVFIILAIYSIALFGFFGRSIPITILGGMGLIYLSLYIHNNGIIIFRDTLTTYFGYLTLGFGIIITFLALLAQFELLDQI